MKKLLRYLLGVLGLMCISCEKFLDAKPNKSVVTISSLDDIDALLNYSVGGLNQGFSGLSEMSSDDYYLSASSFNSLDAFNQRVYNWENKEAFDVSATSINWTIPYRVVLTANLVLEVLEKKQFSDKSKASKLKGEAHFLRGYAYYCLAQIFCPPYKYGGDNTDLGLPIRLESDFNVQTQRATIDKTYNQIIADLSLAAELLEDRVPIVTRASKAAAFAALARTYLAMQNYDQALSVAQKAITLHPDLMDYKTLKVNAANPFLALNAETIYYAFTGGARTISSSGTLISSDLMGLFEQSDARKQLFFQKNKDNTYMFKGFFAGVSLPFTGLCSPDMYLIKAECLARKGQFNQAKEVMSQLLKNRMDEPHFSESQLVDNDLLKFILDERRKEMIFRGTRWSDLRRLNLDNDYSRDIHRESEIAGNFTGMLKANDLKYTFPIPDDVILKTGISQNPQ